MGIKNSLSRRMIVGAVWSFFFIVQPLYAESLYVFYPMQVPPRILQKELINACPSLDITVFGRYLDLVNRVKEVPPDGVLTKMPVAEQLNDYRVMLKGIRNGKTIENYVLLSVDNGVELENIAEMTIGVFDILGRKGMRTFLSRYFSAPPRLKRVSKMEDLLPLLTFGMAQGILISENDVAFFKERSKLNFIETLVPQMSTEVLVLTANSSDGSTSIINCIASLNQNGMQILDVDQWELP